nr:hypothetical protein Iba_chr11dCG9840 [Ipomoea batatas]
MKAVRNSLAMASSVHMNRARLLASYIFSIASYSACSARLARPSASKRHVSGAARPPSLGCLPKPEPNGREDVLGDLLTKAVAQPPHDGLHARHLVPYLIDEGRGQRVPLAQAFMELGRSGAATPPDEVSVGAGAETLMTGGSAASLAAAFFAPRATLVLGRGAAAGATNALSGAMSAQVTKGVSSDGQTIKTDSEELESGESNLVDLGSAWPINL